MVTPPIFYSAIIWPLIIEYVSKCICTQVTLRSFSPDASPQPAVAVKEEVASKGSSEHGEEEMEVDSADDHDAEARAQGGRAQSRASRKDNGAAFNTLSSLSSLRPGNTATCSSRQWKIKVPVSFT